MANIVSSSIKGTRMRVVKVDECGNPVVGPRSVLTTKGFVKVQFDPQVEEGQEFIVKNADGDLAVNDKDRPRLKRYDVTIDLCVLDPDMVNLTTGNRIITRSGGGVTDNVGFAVSEDAAANFEGFSLEVWGRTAGGDCAGGGDRYTYWPVPWLKNALLQSFSIENAALTLQIKAETQANPSFGTGPFDLLDEPMAADEHWGTMTTSVAPPAVVVGAQALSL